MIKIKRKIEDFLNSLKPVVRDAENQLETAKQEAEYGRPASAAEYARGSIEKLESVGVTKGTVYEDAKKALDIYTREKNKKRKAA